MTDTPKLSHDCFDYMAEAVDRIQQYMSGVSQADFNANQPLQDAVMRHLAVLGEAASICAKRMPSGPDDYSWISFAQVYGVKNQQIHGYWTLDLKLVWSILAHHLPELRQQIISCQQDGIAP